MEESTPISEDNLNQLQVSNFQCTNCGDVFDSPDALVNHVESNYFTWYKCEVCEKSLNGIRTLRGHMRQVHNRRGWHACDQCSLSYPTKVKLDHHVKMIHGEPDYQCDICKKKFKFKRLFDIHVANDMHDKNGNWHCEVCGYITKSRGQLNVHRKIVHENEKLFKCEKCPAAYNDTGNLEMHIANIHDGVKYKCELCNKFFTLKKNVARHKKRWHTKNRPLFKCNKCLKNFLSKYNLNLHSKKCESILQKKKKRENDMVKWHKCNICDKMLYGIKALRIHLRKLHERKRDLFCDQCDETFDRLTRLEDHINSIHKNQPYVCGSCDKTFNFRRHLQVHVVKVHNVTQKDTYSCHVCDKEFLKELEFKKHYKALHIKAQEYVCEFCHKKMSTKGCLTKHIGKMHEDKAVLQCNICQKTFYLTDDFEKHVQIVNLNERRSKSVSKYFPNKSSLDTQRMERDCQKAVEGKVVKSDRSKKSKFQTETFECSECHESFVHRKILDKHKAKTHSKSKPAKKVIKKSKVRKIFTKSPQKPEPLNAPKSVSIWVTNYILQVLISNVVDPVKNILEGRKHIGEVNYKVESQVEEVPHSEGKRYECNNCNKSFNFKSHLNKHLKLFHINQGKLQCLKCKKQFKFKYQFKTHKKICSTKIEKKSETCDICDESFYSSKLLEKHVKNTHSKSGYYNCKDCSQSFDRPKYLQDHIDSLHNKKKFKCNICDKNFMLERNLSIHYLRVHKQNEKFQCDICEKDFNTKIDFRKHYIAYHQRVKEYLCEFCNKKFSDKGNRKKHIEHIHMDRKKNFGCEKCNKNFHLIGELTMSKKSPNSRELLEVNTLKGCT